MAWPTPQDYNEALQNPRLSFEDADLQAGTPDITPLGLPRPITGGFASVYSVRSNSRRWAVRCFLRDFADHRERYGEIARHLAAARLPYMVHFQFLEKGIRVRGQWYPILKMEWIEGSTFQEAIEANIQNPEALINLAERWIKMLAALKQHGIAHGDLQHGNILIAGGDFRLIDYDGMFVPSLAGRASHEVGHRNYQHPARVETDFGPHLDNFSGWVIYFTLIALSVDGSFWGRYGNNQEHLLFQKEDFDQPRFSRVFRSLRHIKDDRIQKYLPLFESFLGMRLLAIASPADVIRTRLKKRQSWQTALPAWFSQQRSIFMPETAPAPPAPSIPEPVTTRPEIRPEVIENVSKASPLPASDPIPEPPEVLTIGPVTFAQSMVMERVLLFSYAAIIAILISLSARGIVPGSGTAPVLLAGLVCVMLCLVCSYLLSDVVRSKCLLRFRLEFRRAKCHVLRYAVSRMEGLISRLGLREARQLQRLADKQAEGFRLASARIGEVRRALAPRDPGDRAAGQQISLGRARARWKILKIRRNRRRRGDCLAIKAEDLRFRFKGGREVVKRVRDHCMTLLEKSRADLAGDIAEMICYRDIRFSKYVLRVLGVL
jgi:serine/threonine protein kinase